MTNVPSGETSTVAKPCKLLKSICEGIDHVTSSAILPVSSHTLLMQCYACPMSAVQCTAGAQESNH
eukprot:2248933-Rhodomonas_salina.3